MKFAFRSVLVIGLAGLFVLGMERGRAGPSTTTTRSDVELKTVKYNGLTEAVRSQRGKVVLVDFWGVTCGPCIKAFPHLLEMDQKYRDKGLVCMSVNIDEARSQAEALKFLIDRKATFPNFWLDEGFEVWGERLNITSAPTIFVFNREGRRAAKFYTPEKEYTHEDVENLVIKLLQAKP